MTDKRDRLMTEPATKQPASPITRTKIMAT
jgi:hypothetical protein